MICVRNTIPSHDFRWSRAPPSVSTIFAKLHAGETQEIGRVINIHLPCAADKSFGRQ